MPPKQTPALTFWTIELLKLLPHIANVILVMHPRIHASGWCESMGMLLS